MLNKSMDDLMTQLAQNQLAISDEAVPADLCEALLQDLEQRYAQGELQPASVGRGASLQTQPQIRGDATYWLEENSLIPAQQNFLDFMHNLRQSLNENFFIGVRQLEAHYALYPPGTGYQKHRDQHAGTSHRKITFILYLNKNWQVADGGQLLVYDPHNEENLLQKIEPLFGRLVLFRSEIFPHQVANCNCERKSVTGWFRTLA